MAYKINAIIFLLTLFSSNIECQQINNTTHQPTTYDGLHVLSAWKVNGHGQAYPGKQLVIHDLLISYGVTAIEDNVLKNLNEEVREELFLENSHKGIHVDNFLKFTPAVAVYGLNMACTKGAHNFIDRSALYLFSNVILNPGVFGIKNILTNSCRTDQDIHLSLPDIRQRLLPVQNFCDKNTRMYDVVWYCGLCCSSYYRLSKDL